MGVKLQINPSTGKLSFNASTGKVSVVDSRLPGVCDDCDSPSTIDVTISDLFDCCGVGVAGLNSVGMIPGIASRYNDTFTLNRVIKCLYGVTIDVWDSPAPPEFVYSFYGTPDCTGSPSIGTTITHISVALRVVGADTICSIGFRDIGGANYTTQSWSSPTLLPCFDQEVSEAEFETCEAGYPYTGVLLNYSNLVAGGTAVVSETP